MGKETSRVEAFSDGVFAIAITLLVLDLKAPAEGVPLGIGLLAQWPVYAAYLISFVFILIMWVNHHRMFEHIARIDNNFLYLNGLLLLGITVVPFPTSLVSRYLFTEDEAVATAVYSGWFFLIAIFFNLAWRYAYSRGRLLNEHDRHAGLADAITARYRWGPLAYLAAFLLAFVWAPGSLAVNLLLAIFYALPRELKIPIFR